MVSLTAYLRFAFILYAAYGDADPNLAKRLVDEVGFLFEMYVRLLEEPGKNQRELVNWSPCVVTVWTNVLNLPWNTSKTNGVSISNGPNGRSKKDVDIAIFRQHIPGLYHLAVQMISSDRADVRSVVQKFLIAIGNNFLFIE